MLHLLYFIYIIFTLGENIELYSALRPKLKQTREKAGLCWLGEGEKQPEVEKKEAETDQAEYQQGDEDAPTKHGVEQKVGELARGHCATRESGSS